MHRGGAEVSLEMLMGALKDKFRQILYIHENAKIICSNATVKYMDIPISVLKTKRYSLNAVKAVFHLMYAAFSIKERGIVVSNTYKAHFAGVVAKLLGFKWVMIERDIAEHAAEHLMKRIMYKIADRAIFVSNFAMSANRGKGTVIYNIIKSGYRDKKSYIAFAGDFTYEKGFDRVIDVMSHFSSRQYKYAVIGTKPHYSNIEFSIPEHVEHIRYTEDIYSIFSRTAVLMLFNRKPESFSRVVSESMACGAVPVVLKGNGTDDYVHDRLNGAVVKSYSLENAISSLEKVMNVYDMNKISENAQRTAGQFNTENIAQQWETLFINLER